MRRPRSLSAEEAQLWSRLAATVRPMRGRVAAKAITAVPAAPVAPLSRPTKGRVPAPQPAPAPLSVATRPLDRDGLDTGWERRMAKGLVQPDFTLDLHGHGLDAAWSRLEHGLALALAQNARVVLVITGRPRPVDAADRAARRGAIRAKLLDWLAAGSHASKIAAVRPAHQRHGGAGALYVVMKRPK